MALTRVYGRVVYPHGEDTPTPVTGDGVIEYVHASPGVIGEAVHGPDRHRTEYTDGVAGEAWLKAGMWRAYVYPTEGRSYTLHLGIPESGDVTLADVVGEVVPDGIVTKGDPGEPGEPGRDGQDGQDGHTPEITFDGTTIVVDGTPGPDLKGEPGEGGGGIAGAVPIFSTLAEAQAWEAANPGKVALTLEPSTPDTTPPSWSAILTVTSVGSTKVVVAASAAATGDNGVGYEVSLDGTSWSPITPSGLDFEVTGLSMSTTYTLRFRATDGAGNTSQVLTAPSVTTTAAAPDDYAYQWVAEDFTTGAWADRVSGATLTGTIPASLVGNEVLFNSQGAGYTASGLAGGERRTLMVVARLTSTPNTNLHGFIGQAGPHAIAIPGGGGAKAGWYSHDGATTKQNNVGGNSSVDGGKHVVTVRIDGASSTLTHDRTTIAAPSGPGAVLDTLQVGAAIHGWSHQHAVSEIRIYPRRLTDGELTALHSEMGATYGIPL